MKRINQYTNHRALNDNTIILNFRLGFTVFVKGVLDVVSNYLNDLPYNIRDAVSLTSNRPQECARGKRTPNKTKTKGISTTQHCSPAKHKYDYEHFSAV